MTARLIIDQNDVSPELYKLHQKRIEICNSCNHNWNGICKKCGCLLAAKTRFENFHCPIEKW